MFPPAECDTEEIPFTQTVLSLTEKTNHLAKQMSRFQSWSSWGYEITANEAGEQVKKTDPVTEKRIKTAIAHNPTRTKIWQAPQPRAHNILATPLPEKFLVHHAIVPDLRTRHWWASAEYEFAVPLSLAEKLKEWAFNNDESTEID